VIDVIDTLMTPARRKVSSVCLSVCLSVTLYTRGQTDTKQAVLTPDWFVNNFAHQFNGVKSVADLGMFGRTRAPCPEPVPN